MNELSYSTKVNVVLRFQRARDSGDLNRVPGASGQVNGTCNSRRGAVTGLGRNVPEQGMFWALANEGGGY
jgi:hypothetical protein